MELVVFFFQAEDGIRDRDVTGVQTCALPISFAEMADLEEEFAVPAELQDLSIAFAVAGDPEVALGIDGQSVLVRSEERRVGKECRYRWWTDHYKDDNYYKKNGIE